MTKRLNPFVDDVPVQSKFYITEKEVTRSSEEGMAAVHAKTLRLLFEASSQANSASKWRREQGKNTNANGEIVYCTLYFIFRSCI